MYIVKISIQFLGQISKRVILADFPHFPTHKYAHLHRLLYDVSSFSGKRSILALGKLRNGLRGIKDGEAFKMKKLRNLNSKAFTKN